MRTRRYKNYKTVCYVEIIILVFIFLGGCGRKGDPVPPGNHTPMISFSSLLVAPDPQWELTGVKEVDYIDGVQSI